MANSDKEAKPDGEATAPTRKSRRRRATKPPVTIDLEADAVESADASEAEAAAGSPSGDETQDAAETATPEPPPVPEPPSPPPPSEPPSAPRASGPAGWLNVQTILPAAIGAAIALVVLVILQATGIVPSPGRYEADRAHQRVVSLERRLDTNAAEAAAAREALRAEIGDVAVSTRGLASADNLGDQELRIDALEDALADKASVDQLQASLAALETRLTAATAGADEDAPDATGAATTASGRPAETETETASLPDSDEAPAAVNATERAAAVAMLKRMSVESVPFPDLVDAAAAAGAGPVEAIERLKPLAAAGVPSQDDLAVRYRTEVEPGLRSATASAEGDGDVLGWLQQAFGGVVSVRRMEEDGRADVQTGAPMVAALSKAVNEGNLVAAVAAHSQLPDDLKPVTADWVSDVRDRITVDSLVAQIAAESGAGNG